MKITIPHPDSHIINQRLEMLFNALYYCSFQQELSKGRDFIFSDGERILINQERGALFSQLTNSEEDGIREYKVPDHIEERIQYIKDNIKYLP